MTAPGPRVPVIEIAALSKDYHGLRPLRIEQLLLPAGGHTAVLGMDRPMAEVFINLVTATTLPDSGAVSIFGRPTAAIDDSADWLTIVDRFGIVSERAVLLNALTVIQNLSMPFTLTIDPPPEEIRARAVVLAVETGIPEADWSRPVGDLDAAGHLRIRLARALALDPELLLLEHASAELPRNVVATLGAQIRAIATRRHCALLAVGADAQFAAAVAGNVLVLDPATGRLAGQGRRWPFGRGGG